MGLDPSNPNTAYAFAALQPALGLTPAAVPLSAQPNLVNNFSFITFFVDFLPKKGGISKATRQARRLYVGNLPETTEHELNVFFNEVMKVRNLGFPQRFLICFDRPL
jgi:hypothetical protein